MILIAPAHRVISSNYGSEATSVYLILSELFKNNVEYIAIAGRKDKNDRIFNLLEIGMGKTNIDFHIRVWYFGYKLLNKLNNKVKILHHILPFDMFNGINMLFLKFSGIKVLGPIVYPQVVTSRDDIKITNQNLLIIKLFELLKNNKLLYKYHNKTINSTDFFIFDSYKSYNLFKNFHKIDIELYSNAEVIYLPIDYIFFEDYDKNALKEKDKLVVAHIGALIFRKGHHLFIRAVHDIINEYKEIRDFVKFYIIGKGPLGHYLKNLIYKLNLQDIFEITYFSDRKSLINFLRYNVDIVALSSYSEGLPTIIREGMALGKICISRNVGATDEIIKDGINGFIFESIEELKSKLIDILMNFEKYRFIGDNARRDAKMFHPKEVIQKIIKIYNEFI